MQISEKIRGRVLQKEAVLDQTYGIALYRESLNGLGWKGPSKIT